MSDFTRDELSNIALAAAKEAARQTLSETFALLGVNISDFDQMQDLRDNIAFIHRFRTGTSKVGAKFVMTVVSIASGAVAIGAWEFLRSALK